ncbi:MAG: sigma-54-dependent Fis family transcriptional regulator [SAR324 cluster bacterium]|nr:sigma-54-dependent Fis family transcriptional regulator [SAR324 cluster bacterium]
MEKLLIIDDDTLVRDVLKTTLSTEGYEILTAENGNEGLIALKKYTPQVVILDLKMPKMGGIEFLEALKPEIEHPYSIIVLTGYDTDVEIEKCYALGIQSFLRKPVNICELRGVVKHTFQLDSYSSKLKQEIAEKERAYQLLKSTFDGMAEGVVTLNSNFLVKMVSAKACLMLEVDESDALNKPALTLLGGQIAGPSGILAKHINQKAKVPNIQTKLLCPSGAVIPVRLTIIPLDNESEGNWLLLFRDQREEERLLSKKTSGALFGKMVSSDFKMKELFQVVDNIALSNATVLIQGESGTGKELLAREIHERSHRAQKPFHAVNCAAISANLLESEFFGHDRGAFTGANRNKPGRFELADQGTLFLDEIGEIPVELQVKLLRVLQEQTLEHVGGTKTIHVDVRIVAATSRDLKKMVEEKLFREELYYRLDVISLQLPPLRERLYDIPLLVASFIEQFNAKEQRQVQGISADLLKHLLNYSWPGNVRELYHGIEYAFAVSKENVLQVEHLPNKLRIQSAILAPASEAYPKTEKQTILIALEQANFHKGKAAALLGMSPATLYRKRQKYKID